MQYPNSDLIFTPGCITDQHWMARLMVLADNHAVAVQRDAPGPGSLDEHGGLDYRVLNGERLLGFDHIQSYLDNPNLFGLPKSFVPFHDPLRRANINVLGEGQNYERHVDGTPWTAVVFLNFCNGGALALDIECAGNGAGQDGDFGRQIQR